MAFGRLIYHRCSICRKEFLDTQGDVLRVEKLLWPVCPDCTIKKLREKSEILQHLIHPTPKWRK